MDGEQDLIPVAALKNWLWCRRLVHYQHGAGVEVPIADKMAGPWAAREWLGRSESRRTLARHGLESRVSRFRVRLVSEGLGLSAVAQLLLAGEVGTAVVIFELTAAEPDESHWLQLAAYAALVEDVLAESVDQVMVWRVPDGALVRKAYHLAWRSRLDQVLREVRECLASGRLPAAPEERGR